MQVLKHHQKPAVSSEPPQQVQHGLAPQGS